MPWELGSGNRTDYELHITDAYFAPDAAYQSGETTLLHLVGVDENGEEAKEMYNVGKDWISPDGGKTVKSAKGGVKISRNSMYGHFITAVVELGEDVSAQFETRGDAHEAKVWVGAAFHMNEKEISFGRNLEPTWRNMPDVFIGFDGAEAAPAARPQAATTARTAPAPGVSAADRMRAAIEASKAAKAPAPSATNGAHRSAPAFDAAASLAKASADFEAFVTAAIEIPGLTEDDELSSLVFDPTEAGFYALNH